jgi:putative endopeptidase
MRTNPTLAVALTLLLAAAAAPAAEETAQETYTTNESGLDRRNLDPAADPCEDFYRYANGMWMERNPIPEEQSSWGMSSELRERIYEVLRQILETSAAAEAEPGTNKRKAGDFWRTAMDTERLERAGAEPLAADLERIAAIDDPAGIQAFIDDFHAQGTTLLFDPAVFQDLKNSEQYIFYATQGGLGLPDRDYYTREDDESAQLRASYVAHVSRMLQLLGEPAESADAAARTVLALETRLAEASLTNVELRDPANFYNIQTVAAAEEATPNYSWSKYFERLGLADLETFSFAQPKFFAEIDTLLEELPLDSWKSYLRWHVVNNAAPYLSAAFVEQDFDFYGRTLQGTRELKPRWKRAVDRVSASMGEALGQVYVETAFPPATKARADEMIENLRAAVGVRIQALPWMGDETKARALEKLGTFTSKIGYPDEWRDYSRLEIGRDSYLANVRSGDAFEMRRNLEKMGQPIDKNEWRMAPQTVNAYYSPVANEIVFPAAIMQPPYFDGEMDDAVNYGAMGAVIGHEFMHGFDDKGSKFDAQGNMSNWWTDQDRANFEERTSKLVAQYGEYVAVDDLHVNGELTLGENIGDLAGLTMAYHALQMALAESRPDKIDGFTPEQRFFLSWAQAWRRNYRDEALKLQVNTDPHSPARFRTLGPLANMPEFAAAFGCEEGDAMVRAAGERAVIW